MRGSVLSAQEHAVNQHVASAARQGLSAPPRRLPPWLFYDETGSRLFDAITELDEYYLTRTERGILASHAGRMIAAAAGNGARLRIAELGAGSAEKTRILLHAAVERQGQVIYEPIDVSASALETAQKRIEREIAGVRVLPRVMDYMHGSSLRLNDHEKSHGNGHGRERRLVLYIGSSIGNFEPDEAALLLGRVRLGLAPGDALLLGVDLVKDESILLAAYDDASGVTAAFNRNVLVRLNRELAADFDPLAFAHRAIWNPARSRIEMHLESRFAQRVRLAALGTRLEFAAGETIHTENSYKYAPGQAEALLAGAGFAAVERWTDPQGWFAVYLARMQ
ncbi:MAG TPA: L-histidine N(alpha)-methyltransferase [Terracidiphilus sp.]|nr:L-histidine N(alpha)-methyltransferase [Terracidiphilus sp.]